jgi:hypothetical protein
MEYSPYITPGRRVTVPQDIGKKQHRLEPIHVPLHEIVLPAGADHGVAGGQDAMVLSWDDAPR